MCSAAKNCFSLVHIQLPQHACILHVVTVAAKEVRFEPPALPQTRKRHMIADVLSSAQKSPTDAAHVSHQGACALS